MSNNPFTNATGLQGTVNFDDAETQMHAVLPVPPCEDVYGFQQTTLVLMECYKKADGTWSHLSIRHIPLTPEE